MKRIVAMAVLLIANPVFGQESEQGWGVSFRRTTFDGKTFPVGIMAEGGQTVGGVSLVVSCGRTGSLVPILNESFSVGNEPKKMSFRSESSTIDVTFTVGPTAFLGRRYQLSGSESESFFTLFKNATSDVSYRLDEKQGKFSSIGAANIFDFAMASCSGS
ncbi:hypothetical protein [Agrobacterium pusense]|uniref:hypothetical protein n=1 Tax=Agrobacterium pusense TaxID=648995 RepID=UPI000A90D64B|nr:hypothetical protein [Agrobacterium pusense]QWW74493.1 hypothetical protein KP800_03080 [Agrobacterium pusense]